MRKILIPYIIGFTLGWYVPDIHDKAMKTERIDLPNWPV